MFLSSLVDHPFLIEKLIFLKKMFVNYYPKMSTTEEILNKVKSGELDINEATKKIATLSLSENRVTYKVSQKGAISFYGIRRMPITLYREELQQILDVTESDEFTSWLEDNKSNFSTKENKK